MAGGAVAGALTAGIQLAQSGKPLTWQSALGVVQSAYIGAAFGALGGLAGAGAGVLLGKVATSLAGSLAGGATGGSIRTALTEAAQRVTQRISQSLLPTRPVPGAGGAKPWLSNTAAQACSFSGATVVLMADGSEKRIDEVAVGEMVVASDAETGLQGARPVEEVFVHEDTIVDLRVGGEVISTTEDHPFWSVTDQRFERADELTAGELVLTAAGSVLTVRGIVSGFERVALAYNLSVQGIHTYHVGEAQVLVHNVCGPGTLWSATSTRSPAENALSHFGDHKSDFPYMNNALEYVQEAQGFLRNPPSGVLTTIRSNGDVVRFDPATDNFGVMNAAGNPRTYFKPDPAEHGYPTNMDYFNAQG